MRRGSVLFGISALAMVGLVAYGYGVLGERDDGTPRFRTVAAQRGPVTAAVSATGAIAAVVDPLPSCPLALFPHAATNPSAVNANI